MVDTKYRNDTLNAITRVTTIANSLETCDGFKMACDDLKKNVDNIDSHWHLVPQDEKWESRIKEMRVTKMASVYVINMVKAYRDECERLTRELDKIDNPDTVVQRDYDTAGGKYEEGEDGIQA
jgi:hypothetical protein